MHVSFSKRHLDANLDAILDAIFSIELGPSVMGSVIPFSAPQGRDHNQPRFQLTFEPDAPVPPLPPPPAQPNAALIEALISSMLSICPARFFSGHAQHLPGSLALRNHQQKACQRSNGAA